MSTDKTAPLPEGSDYYPSEKRVDYAPKKELLGSFVFTFLILFAIWILFSGKFDLFHLTLGVICCAIVSWFSCDLILPSRRLAGMGGLWWRFIRYIPWLIYQVLVANIHVFYLAAHPRMMEIIDPQIMSFKSHLKSEMALVTLANSITLTPGTITVYVSIYGDISFHVIDIASGKTLPFIMEARVAEIFGE